MYPSSRMDECLDTIGDEEYFTTFDAYYEYWQIKIRAKDLPKTSFVCHAGTLQFAGMHFELTNVPACFQRDLYLIFTKFKWKTCLIDLDDVIIFYRDVHDHIEHVDEILKKLADAVFALKINKCHFFQRRV